MAGAVPAPYPSPGVVVAYKVIPSGVPMASLGPTFDGGPAAMAAAASGGSGLASFVPPSAYYSFSTEAGKYDVCIAVYNEGLTTSTNTAAIAANPTPNFCVGQPLTFWIAVAPEDPNRQAPNYTILANNWSFTGTFFNSCSNNYMFPTKWRGYFRSPDLLRCATTSAWWVSGGDPKNTDPNKPSEYQATCSNLKIAIGGGNPITLAPIYGKFNMFRPQGKITAHCAARVTVLKYDDGTGRLQLAPEGGKGIVFDYHISYPTNFPPGSLSWVQVVTSPGPQRWYTTQIGNHRTKWVSDENGKPGPNFLDHYPNSPYIYPYDITGSHGDPTSDSPDQQLESNWITFGVGT